MKKERGERSLLKGIPRPEPEFAALVSREMANANARAREILPIPGEDARRTWRRTTPHGLGCKSCGCALDDNNPDCKTCWSRHYQRRNAYKR